MLSASIISFFVTMAAVLSPNLPLLTFSAQPVRSFEFPIYFPIGFACLHSSFAHPAVPVGRWCWCWCSRIVSCFMGSWGRFAGKRRRAATAFPLYGVEFRGDPIHLKGTHICIHSSGSRSGLEKNGSKRKHSRFRCIDHVRFSSKRVSDQPLLVLVHENHCCFCQR